MKSFNSPLIARETNPWIAIDGTPLDMIGYRVDPSERCDTCADSPIPGVILGMDDNYGIQRCDSCAIYDGDLEAAVAVAVYVVKDPRASVCFTPYREEA